MSTNTMRFATLFKKHGPVKLSTECTDAEWKQACAEGRFATVYHPERDWITPVEGLINHHGCCNTLCKIKFDKAVPTGVTKIIGMRNSQEAFELCNPEIK